MNRCECGRFVKKAGTCGGAQLYFCTKHGLLISKNYLERNKK